MERVDTDTHHGTEVHIHTEGLPSADDEMDLAIAGEEVDDDDDDDDDDACDDGDEEAPFPSDECEALNRIPTGITDFSALSSMGLSTPTDSPKPSRANTHGCEKGGLGDAKSVKGSPVHMQPSGNLSQFASSDVFEKKCLEASTGAIPAEALHPASSTNVVGHVSTQESFQIPMVDDVSILSDLSEDPSNRGSKPASVPNSAPQSKQATPRRVGKMGMGKRRDLALRTAQEAPDEESLFSSSHVSHASPQSKGKGYGKGVCVAGERDAVMSALMRSPRAPRRLQSSASVGSGNGRTHVKPGLRGLARKLSSQSVQSIQSAHR
jgi:hypothetical protein